MSRGFKESSIFPGRDYLKELRRPWKLGSFAIGMSWLIYGALQYQISDWDVGISLIMGGLTYICAPWSVATILCCVRYRPRKWFLQLLTSLAVAWLVVDGVYLGYHNFLGHQMYRYENLKASSALYFLAGSIWLYRGSLHDFMNNIRIVIRRK